MVWFLSIFMVKTDMSWESYDARYFCEEKVMHLWYSNNLPFSQLLIGRHYTPYKCCFIPSPPSPPYDGPRKEQHSSQYQQNSPSVTLTLLLRTASCQTPRGRYIVNEKNDRKHDNNCIFMGNDE